MLKAHYQKYVLHFKSPVLTSRGQMVVKNGYYITITDRANTGTGECSYIEDLSRDDLSKYELKLQELCQAIAHGQPQLVDLANFPSIIFGFETALKDLENGGKKILLDTGFTQGKTDIAINGLVWMGTKNAMLQQVQQKLDDGFSCIKIKVGAIDFNDELILLNYIRQKFPPDMIEIRLDANGAFTRADVFTKLEQLAQFNIHSIEQPIKPGQYTLMEKLCSSPIIPIALDEELIDLKHISKTNLLQQIKPQYLILKPSLLGGWAECDEWIYLAEQTNTGWWATSALESNIGLNAIAQWTAAKNINMPQGLGTGGLYNNNIASPLYIKNGCLLYNPLQPWGDTNNTTTNISQ